MQFTEHRTVLYLSIQNGHTYQDIWEMMLHNMNNVKLDTHRNWQRHRAVLPEIARLSCLRTNCLFAGQSVFLTLILNISIIMKFKPIINYLNYINLFVESKLRVVFNSVGAQWAVKRMHNFSTKTIFFMFFEGAKRCGPSQYIFCEVPNSWTLAGSTPMIPRLPCFYTVQFPFNRFLVLGKKA